MSVVVSKNDVANSVSAAEPSPVAEVVTVSALLPDDVMSSNDVAADVLENVFVIVDSLICADTVSPKSVLDTISVVAID